MRKIALRHKAALNIFFDLIIPVGSTHVLDVFRRIVCVDASGRNKRLQNIAVKIDFFRGKMLFRFCKKRRRNKFDTRIDAVLVPQTFIFLVHPPYDAFRVDGKSAFFRRRQRLCYKKRTVVRMTVRMRYKRSPCFFFTVKINKTAEVNVEYRIAAQKQKVIIKAFHSVQSAGGAQRGSLFVIGNRDAELRAVSEIFADKMTEVADDKRYIGKTVCLETCNLMLKHGPAADADHRLGNIACNGCDACSSAAGHDDCFHLKNLASSWRQSA